LIESAEHVRAVLLVWRGCERVAAQAVLVTLMRLVLLVTEEAIRIIGASRIRAERRVESLIKAENKRKKGEFIN